MACIGSEPESKCARSFKDQTEASFWMRAMSWEPVILLEVRVAETFRIMDLFEERQVVRQKLIELGFIRNALGIEEERAIAFDVKGLVFRRNLVLRFQFVF